jgi:hypothetical protein
MTHLVYVDTETTGLDPDRHQVWEIAWATEQRQVYSMVVPHTLTNADPVALALNGHDSRCPAGTSTNGHEEWGWSGAEMPAELAVRTMLVGATMVGANPAFDAAFLRRRWGFAPWHHRLLDVEVFAMGALGLDRPLGLEGLAQRLHASGPKHTAASDVRSLIQCHDALTSIYFELRSRPERI